MAGLYVHIEQPASNRDPSLHKRGASESYVEALRIEITGYAATHGNDETLEALSIGGFTHALPAQAFKAIMDAVMTSFDAVTLEEASIDVHPGKLTFDALQGLRALGFDRINILAGSFFDEDLERMQAPFDAGQVIAQVEDARMAGFQQIGAELSLTIDSQPPEYWGANLEKAVRLGIDHLSLQMHGSPTATVHPREIARCLSFPALDEEMRDRFGFAIDYLTEAGYDHYTLASFARPTTHSRYTRLHQDHANLLSIGPGAHSFWWFGGSRSRAHRWSNVTPCERYEALLARRELPIDTRSLLTLDELANEYIVLRLPALEGLNLETLETVYGVDLFMERIDEIAWLESQGLIEPVRNSRILLTRTGKLHAADVMSRLLIDD